VENNKNFWQKFNPSLKEITEKYPDLTLLGLWWAWYWRLMILVLVVYVIFAILVKFFG